MRYYMLTSLTSWWTSIAPWEYKALPLVNSDSTKPGVTIVIPISGANSTLNVSNMLLSAALVAWKNRASECAYQARKFKPIKERDNKKNLHCKCSFLGLATTLQLKKGQWSSLCCSSDMELRIGSYKPIPSNLYPATRD